MSQTTTNGKGNKKGNGKKTAEAQPQPEPKLKYDHILLCPNCSGTHGTVVFTNGSGTLLDNPVDIDRICGLMDDGSVLHFCNDVADLQAQGKLQDLLSPEVRAKREAERRAKAEREERQRQRDAKIEQLAARGTKLTNEYNNLRVANLSHHTLAQDVTAVMLEALEEPVMRELAERGMFITIGVVTDINPDDMNLAGSRKIMELVVNPMDVINKRDVSEDKERIVAELKKITDEITQLNDH